jgi:glutathione S-transferase
MTKPRLTYFDAPISRGEECRLALHLAGVDFEDNRIQRSEWPALKPTSPLGGLPFLEMPGHPPLGESIAILVLIGRLHGLHPRDDFEAARHESLMCHVESLRAAVGSAVRIADEAESKKAREGLVATHLPEWARHAEKHIGDGPFVAGAKLHVVDLKLHMVVRWLAGGKVDHIPTTIFSGFPKLVRVHDAVRDDARIESWYARG